MVSLAFKTGFEETLKTGKEGEAILLRFFRERYPDWQIEDLSDNPDFYFSERDFKVTKPNGEVVYIELKTDTYSRSNNLVVEMVANKEIGRAGWAVTSEADILAYLYINGLNDNTPNLYFISMSTIRELSSQARWRTYSIKEPNHKGTGSKTTWGYLIPRTEIPYLSAYKTYTKRTINQHGGNAKGER